MTHPIDSDPLLRAMLPSRQFVYFHLLLLLMAASSVFAGLQALEISAQHMAAHTIAGIARLTSLTTLIADVSVLSMELVRCEFMSAQQQHCDVGRLRFVEFRRYLHHLHIAKEPWCQDMMHADARLAAPFHHFTCHQFTMPFDRWPV